MKEAIERIQDPKEERLRLQNLKLKLEIWKIMKNEGFTLDEAHEAMKGRSAGKLETPALEERFETTELAPTEWQHKCKAAGREVTLPLSINQCHLCGKVNKK